MTDARKDVATDYGEGDIEAKAMDNAAKEPIKPKRPAGPPHDNIVPASGTTESDVAENLRQQAERESKS